ncbi:MAG: hypothetical protein M3P30_12655 [Chloroflexota bacterium]|nr:hypothetical protein [Chloroflexota bacterium]
MKVALLRVGIDSGSGGGQGPLFRDGSFEYLPIPDGFGLDERTYGNTLGRHGRYLADYLAPSLRARLLHSSMHVDPEFAAFTYGDPTPPKSGLRRLVEGDMLVFYCGLEGFGFASAPALYIMGYFEILIAGKATDFASDDIDRLFGENFHVRHRGVFERQRSELVLVKGSRTSRLLSKAVCISDTTTDRTGKPLKVLSEEMQRRFGGFGGRISIQRSPTRWVEDAFTSRAAEFVRSLE